MNYTVSLRDTADKVATKNEIKFFFDEYEVSEMVTFINIAVGFIDHSPSSIVIDIGG